MGEGALLENVKVRLAADDHQALKALAKLNERSVGAEIRLAVRAYLAAQKEVAA